MEKAPVALCLPRAGNLRPPTGAWCWRRARRSPPGLRLPWKHSAAPTGIPFYLYVRRRGHSPEDAQDLTQALFARLLEKNSLAAAHPHKGRFRSFLLGALKHLLADEHAKAQAKKRGGGQVLVSWEQATAEAQFSQEPTDEESPDRLFDRRWALTVLERAVSRLREEYCSGGDGPLFERLKVYVTGEMAAPSYADTAAALGLSESAVKSAIYRLRRRYHELVRDEVAQTVADPNELEAEIRHLMAVFNTSRATF
jgi:DNA-directed RNA polymerase specialized sigma24 family protein